MGILDKLTGATPSRPSASVKPSTTTSKPSGGARNAPKTVPSSSPPSRASQATTLDQGNQIRADQSRHHRQQDTIEEAVLSTRDEIRKLNTPRGTESPTQLQDVINALATIAQAVARIEAKIDTKRSADVVKLRG